MARTRGTRTILTKQQARAIFQLKHTHGFSSLSVACNILADAHKVSEKAIRDIWTGRSWLDVTFDLWDSSDRPHRKVIGRPKGRRDAAPRRPRSAKPAQTRPSNSADNFPVLEALDQGRNTSSLAVQGADTRSLLNLASSPIEFLGMERSHGASALFGEPMSTLLPPLHLVRDPLRHWFEPGINQAGLGNFLPSSQLILQNLISALRGHARPPLVNPCFPSSPFSTSPRFIQSAQISGCFLMHQLASPVPVQDFIGAYRCQPSPNLSQSHHRLFNLPSSNITTSSWLVPSFEPPPGLFTLPSSGPPCPAAAQLRAARAPPGLHTLPRSGPALAPPENAYLLGTAHPLGH